MKKTTKFANPKKLSVKWHLLDAKGKVLGRLATQIANLLNGKKDVEYSPNIYTKNKVVVINSDKVIFTGKKLTQKKYIWHSGYPRGLKSLTLGEMMSRDSRKVIREAVKGMLPKNKLQKVKLANLYIYKDENHEHGANLVPKDS